MGQQHHHGIGNSGPHHPIDYSQHDGPRHSDQQREEQHHLDERYRVKSLKKDDLYSGSEELYHSNKPVSHPNTRDMPRNQTTFDASGADKNPSGFGHDFYADGSQTKLNDNLYPPPSHDRGGTSSVLPPRGLGIYQASSQPTTDYLSSFATSSSKADWFPGKLESFLPKMDRELVRGGGNAEAGGSFTSKSEASYLHKYFDSTESGVHIVVVSI